MQWFRLYDSLIDDPKIQRLPVETRWLFVEILCVANRQEPRGTLPGLRDIAFILRKTEAKCGKQLAALVAVGLIDVEDGKPYRVHGWEKRQRKGDDATQRWRKYISSAGASAGASAGKAKGSSACASASEQNRAETEENPSLPPFEGGEGKEYGSRPREPGDIGVLPFDGGPPDQPGPAIPSDHKPILRAAANHWGADGEAVVSDMLRTFKPAIVREAAKAHYLEVGDRIHPSRLRKTAQAMLDGRWRVEKPAPPIEVFRAGVTPHPGLMHGAKS